MIPGVILIPKKRLLPDCPADLPDDCPGRGVVDFLTLRGDREWACRLELQGHGVKEVARCVSETRVA